MPRTLWLSLSLFAPALLSAALAFPAPALACKCMFPPVATAREGASAVFEGRVVAIEKQTPPGDVMGRLRVTMAVVRSWKGLERDERIDVYTNSESAACGVMFAVDTSWLVYADAREGQLDVSACSRTRRIADAAEDLAVLGAGSTPVRIEPKARSLDGGADVGDAGVTSGAGAASLDAGLPPQPQSTKRGGGCASGRTQASLGGWLLSLPAVGLVLRRHRRARRD